MVSLVVDGSNILHRAFWVNAEMSSHIFFSIINKYAREYEADNVIVAWDKKRDWPARNYRFDIYPEYKGNRDKDKNAPVFYDEGVLFNICEAAGYKNMFPAKGEADDVIAWCCNEWLSNRVYILSADRDLLQLINERVTVIDPNKKKEINLGNFKHHIKLDIDVSDYVLFKCLTGDSSDNVKGLNKVGPKRALSIIKNGLDSLDEESKSITERNKKIFDLTVYGASNIEGEVDYYKEQAAIDCKFNQTKLNMLLEEAGLWRTKNSFSDLSKIGAYNDLFELLSK